MRNGFAGLILVAALVAPLGAQSSHATLGAFYGLIYTPAGALPEIVRVQSPHDSASRATAEMRFGRYRYRNSTVNFDNYGLSGSWSLLSRMKVGAVWAYRT